MERHIYRTLGIIAVIVVSVILIYPTIGWMTLDDGARVARLEQWREQDNERAKEPSNFFQRAGWGIKRWAEFDRDQVINLGLDLQGGVHMVVGFDMPDQDTQEERELEPADVQEMVLQRILNRVNDFEAKEPIIQKLGTNQVQIQLPGEKDVQRAKDLIMQTAFLTFHMAAGPDETEPLFRAIDQFSDNGFVPFLELPLMRGGQYQVSQENYDRVAEIVSRAEAAGIIPADKLIAFSTPPKPWEDRGYLIYLLEREAGTTGEGLKTAKARPDNTAPGQWQIIFEFDTDGARDFAELTGANIGRNMAIVLDGKVVSAPVINDRIFAVGNIAGSFSADEARDLAISLNSGSMPVPIREDYTGVVGATLGAGSVEKSVRSGIIGLIIVIVFVTVYYRIAGIITTIALLVNSLMVVALLAYFNETLTLPGIAGLILTIGMAVDSNVLIFERIREELRNGKSLASAIEAGFNRVTITILDANVTTLIAAAVLIQFGTGPVQGFAISLSIGVCTSVFTALVVTRALLDFVCQRKLVKTLNMMSFVKPDTRYPFMAVHRYAFAFSGALIAIGMVIFAVRGQDNFGVDFTNGTNMIIAVNSPNDVQVAEVRTRLEQAGFKTPSVQEYQEDPDANNQFVVRVSDVTEVTSEATDEEKAAGVVSTRVQRALADLTNDPQAADLDAQVELLRVETVGPAVGKRLQRDALLAITYSMMFIMVYLWFRFELKYAVAVVIALIHDVLFTLGLFAVFGFEISLPSVAAFLTIIGYSLNDSIVVFDRIRENLKLTRGRTMSFSDIIDASVNQTLSRTLLTSLTTLFTVVVLFIFGGGAIRDFAFALLVGIIVGTYSSIYIASSIVYYWQRWRESRIGASGEGPGGGDKEGGPTRRISKRKKKKPRPDSTEPATA